MVGFRSIREYTQAEEAGKFAHATFRKTPTLGHALSWGQYDLSYSNGNPPANYYATTPLIAAGLDGFRGIFHGDDVASGSKFINKMAICCTATNNAIGNYFLCDYVMYYPFIDGDTSDEQLLDNTFTLPRYETGEGLFPIMVVMNSNSVTGTFTFNYTDSDGNAKTSPLNTVSPNAGALSSGCIATSNPTASPGIPHLMLAGGERGVRSIQSVTFTGLSGGLFAIVLVKKLAVITITETAAATEKEFITGNAGMPEIKNGAFLGLVSSTNGSIAGQTLIGNINYIWS